MGEHCLEKLLKLSPCPLGRGAVNVLISLSRDKAFPTLGALRKRESCARGAGGVRVNPSVFSSEEILRGLFGRLPPSSTGLFSLLFFQDKELGSVKE